MKAIVINPGRQTVQEVDVPIGPPVTKLDNPDQNTDRIRGMWGGEEFNVEDIPGLDDHFLVVGSLERYATEGPAFFLKSDPTCRYSCVGVVLGKDRQGFFTDVTATVEQVTALVGYITHDDRPRFL